MTRQVFDHNDWQAATGSYLVRDGVRPMRVPQRARVTPKASGNSGRLQREIAALIARSRAPTAPPRAVSKQARKLALARAIASAPRASKPSRSTQITSSGAYWRASYAEQLRTLGVLQRFHGPR